MRNRNERGEIGPGAIVAIVIFVVALPFLIWGGSVLLAPLFGAGNAYKTTEAGDYRISNYEMFKNDCNAIVAKDVAITTAQNAVDTEVKGAVDSFREQQVVQNLQALTNGRAEQITDYNSAASMNTTRAKFKDAGLPDYIDPNSPIGSVTCPSV